MLGKYQTQAQKRGRGQARSTQMVIAAWISSPSIARPCRRMAASMSVTISQCAPPPRRCFVNSATSVHRWSARAEIFGAPVCLGKEMS